MQGNAGPSSCPRVPAGQSVQPTWPGVAAKRPQGGDAQQSAQGDDGSASLSDVPTGQILQLMLPTGAYLPVAHVSHTADAATDTAPAAQYSHRAAPGDEYCPAAHAEHGAAVIACAPRTLA